MEEIKMPEFTRDPGFHEYINAGLSGFLATLKSRPEDFVVTEINSKEKLVILSSYELPPPLPLLPSPPPPQTSTSSKRKGHHGSSSRPDPNTVPPLKDLITSEQYKSIEQLYHKYKTTLSCDQDHIVNLGHIMEKEVRSSIHCSLRLTFPALSTNISKNEKNEIGLNVIPDPNYKRLVEVLTPEESENVLTFLNTYNSSISASDHMTLSTGYTRPQRTKIHHLLSELFGRYISTHTTHSSHKVPKLDKGITPSPPHTSNIVIRIRKKKDHLGGDVVRGEAKRKPEENADVITKFVLWKRNQETFHVIHKLSQLLNCGVSQFSLCGTKDKIAITAQEITVKGITPQKLLLARERLNLHHFDIGNFEYVRDPLHLGDHVGNRFKIILRSLKPKMATGDSGGVVIDKGMRDLEGVVTSALESVREFGFINYYGCQRFNRTMTMPRTGLALLHNDVRGAVNTALLESGRVNDDVKDHVRKGEFEMALTSLSSDMTREQLMLQKLKQYGGTDYGYSRAIMSIPYNHRILYIHSLSSLIWNHAASYRIAEYGLKPVEGDIVLVMEEKQDEDATYEKSLREQVQIMTSHDVTSQQYSLKDVVLPVIGTSIIYPSNKVGDRIHQLMDEAGLSLATFRLPQLGIHARGSYRKLVAYPRQLSWKLTSSPGTEATQASGEKKSIDDIEKKGDISEPRQPVHSKLELHFDLSVSTYVTMLIRELTKMVYE